MLLRERYRGLLRPVAVEAVGRLGEESAMTTAAGDLHGDRGVAEESRRLELLRWHEGVVICAENQRRQGDPTENSSRRRHETRDGAR